MHTSPTTTTDRPPAAVLDDLVATALALGRHPAMTWPVPLHAAVSYASRVSGSLAYAEATRSDVALACDHALGTLTAAGFDRLLGLARTTPLTDLTAQAGRWIVHTARYAAARGRDRRDVDTAAARAARLLGLLGDALDATPVDTATPVNLRAVADGQVPA